MRAQFYFLVFTICVFTSYAQNSVSGKRNVGEYVGGMDMNDFAIRSGYNTSEILGKFYNNEKPSNNLKREGSSLLFEGWNNNGIIVVGNKNYRLNNLNYDIKQDMFLSKINNDSIFVFDFANIDKIILNNKHFKRIYNASLNQNKIYEVIYEDDNFSLLKYYFVVVTEGSPDPMMNRPNDVIRKKSAYFLMKNNLIEPFKWNKKSIIGLVDNGKRGNLEKYVRRNNLSYKDESDVSKLLKYFQ